MTLRRDIPLLTLSLLLALGGCTPGDVPTNSPGSGPSATLNEVRSSSNKVVEELIAQFPEAQTVTAEMSNVYPCLGEEAGVGHWMMALDFSSTEVLGGVANVRESSADIESSYGTSAQNIEYADGTTWPVPAHHVLLEDETGSYLLTYNGTEAGMVSVRIITACGVLK